MEALNNMIDRSEAQEMKEDEYLAHDGLLHCKKCGGKRQTIISFMGKERKVHCICQCQQTALEDQKKNEIIQNRERAKMICFRDTNMKDWTFENDDRHNEKISDAMKKYAEQFPDFKKEGKGLLMYGTVGTGKTYYAACIANTLIDSGYSVLMTNFAQIGAKLQGMYEGKDEYMSSLNRYSLLILDDLGAERKSEYMQEIVFNVIDARYRSGKPMIITTNLSADELKQAKDIGNTRIYDRIFERCIPVAVSGSSRRKQELRENYGKYKERLGL